MLTPTDKDSLSSITTHTTSPQTLPVVVTFMSSPLGVLQNNVSGFVYLPYVPHVQFSQFLKQSSSASTDGDDQDAKQRDFNKRMGRSDAEFFLFSLFLTRRYLRSALSNFCEETRRLYSEAKPQDYAATPLPSP